MQPTANLGKYLGMSLFHEKSSKKDFQYIIDRMVSKLNRWKANTLFSAGRITLAQSGLFTIPSYLMQTTRIAVSICDKIDRILLDIGTRSRIEWNRNVYSIEESLAMC